VNVEQMLKEYPEKKAKLETLKIELEGLMDNINRGYGIMESDEETIEGMTFALNMDGMPKAHNNESKVERIVEEYKKEQERLKKPLPANMFMQKRNLEHRIKALELEISMVDALMIALTTEEKLVIQKFYLEGLPWRYVREEYKKRFGEPKEKQTLKRIRREAICKMSKIIA
jgi:hypothetical protein